jgi:hemolysin activation/secretion protein
MLSLALSLAALFFATEPAAAEQQQPPPTTGQVEQSLQKKKDPKEDPTKPPPKVEIQPRAEMTSEDDTKVRIKVEKLKITGAKSFSESDLQDVARAPGGIVGREMTLAELKQAANHITMHYRNEGFGLAWAYVPVQDVKDGVVEIAVVEGRVDKILVTGNAYYSAEFIIDHVDRLQKQNTLSLDSLERGLMILNTYLGMTVRSTLRQGDSPGTTDLYLNAEDKFPISFSIDFDNFGPRSTGEDRLGATLTAFNLYDLGHWVSLRGVTSVDKARGDTTNGRLDYTIPFKDGTRVNAYASLYDYKAKGPVKVIEPQGSGDVFGIDLSHPVIMNHEMSLSTHLGFDYKTLEQELLGQKNSKDQIRAVTLGASFDYTDDLEGRWNLSGDFRQGLGGFLGGTKENDPDASRIGADNSFTKFNVTLFRLQHIASWLSLIGKVQAQYAFHELLVSEQFALGGQDSVRGYAPFEFMGDRGYTGTMEARIGIPWLADVKDPFRDDRTLVDTVQLAGFLDSGAATRIDPLQGERHKLVLTGAGAGIRIYYPDWVSIRFDVAKPISSFESASGRDTWYYISVIVNLH